MKMRKIAPFITAIALALAVGPIDWAPAQARQFGFITDAATVDDVTTTVCTTTDNESVRGFGNGVDVDQVWALQVEVGSPGSGVWATVGGLTDVFPTAFGAAAVGGPVQVMNHTAQKPSCFRLRMTTDGGGTAQIQLVAGGNAGTPDSDLTRTTHANAFDDMFHPLLPLTVVAGLHTPAYFVNDESGGANVIGVMEGGQEGLFTMSSGGDGDAADEAMLTYGLVTAGSLVSSGLTVFEFRASMSQITDARINFGLGDTIGNTTEFELFKCNTNVCAESTGAGSADAAVFLFDTDSADAQTDMWNAVSMNASTLGNAADEYTLGSSPVASTFAIFRIEVDSAGNAYWYYNGSLVAAESLAVATTAVLIPNLTSGSPDDGSGTANKIYVDYMSFWVPRPAT